MPALGIILPRCRPEDNRMFHNCVNAKPLEGQYKGETEEERAQAQLESCCSQITCRNPEKIDDRCPPIKKTDTRPRWGARRIGVEYFTNNKSKLIGIF